MKPYTQPSGRSAHALPRAPGLTATPAGTHQAGGEAFSDLLDQGLDVAGQQLEQDVLCGQSRAS